MKYAALKINHNKLKKFGDLKLIQPLFGSVIQEANVLLDKILDSLKFRLALDKFKDEYSFSDDNEAMISHLKKLVDKIIFVQSGIFEGMVGLN